MPSITYVHPNGDEQVIEVVPGTSVMRAAVTNGVDGIVGECGGQAMCATCHVYVRDEFLAALAPMNDDEEEMLEETAAPRDEERSRLGCQLKMGSRLESIVVDLPSMQVEE
ncbi:MULTISPECIES: 2Fe-2S iron-sulfur cluster-binding protein [Subtercola]|uniref:Ferredoxin n=1 Tax=Subtercola vilae TaxID=2056433 RepID=A0A4T2C4L7_9MICO|nr:MULTISPECIES: 2Fe-2S iron-sulfur cluster-binding protein [Subtercola]MEA9984189.1 2Fe-2S iron-sulfur cluster-binding protein [Subtercola sp. RTI3]TIH37426.1 ferredoxin [Subtercola vilae]